YLRCGRRGSKLDRPHAFEASKQEGQNEQHHRTPPPARASIVLASSRAAQIRGCASSVFSSRPASPLPPLRASRIARVTSPFSSSSSGTSFTSAMPRLRLDLRKPSRDGFAPVVRGAREGHHQLEPTRVEHVEKGRKTRSSLPVPEVEG